MGLFWGYYVLLIYMSVFVPYCFVSYYFDYCSFMVVWSECMSIGQWMDKEGVPYTYSRILPSHKNNNIVSFRATWTDLERTMLSEISQIK